MLLRLYRSNQPVVMLFLPLIGLIFWMPSFLSPEGVPTGSQSGPLFDLLTGITSGIYWLQTLIGYAFVIAGAIILNRIFNREELTERENYVPALTWLILWSFSEDLCVLHPVQPAMIFTILAAGRLAATYGKSDIRRLVYDAGLFMGISILIYPSIWVVLPLIWIALVILRTFNWREWFIPIVGLATPFALAWALGFLFEFEWQLADYMEYKNAVYPVAGEYIGSVYWVAAFITILITLSGLRLFIASISATTMQKRNVKQVMLFFGILLAAAYVNSAFLDQQAYQVSLLFPAMAIWIAVYVQEAKRKWLATFSYYAWAIFFLWFFYV